MILLYKHVPFLGIADTGWSRGISCTIPFHHQTVGKRKKHQIKINNSFLKIKELDKNYYYYLWQASLSFIHNFNAPKHL